MNKKKLHVLEHPALHGKPNDSPPVHVVYEDHEFDWWSRAPDGSLHIGFYREKVSIGNPNFPSVLNPAVTVIIQPSWYVKAWLEEIAVATAPVSSLEAIMSEETGRHAYVEAEAMATTETHDIIDDRTELLHVVERADVFDDRPPKEEPIVTTVTRDDDREDIEVWLKDIRSPGEPIVRFEPATAPVARESNILDPGVFEVLDPTKIDARLDLKFRDHQD